MAMVLEHIRSVEKPDSIWLRVSAAIVSRCFTLKSSALARQSARLSSSTGVASHPVLPWIMDLGRTAMVKGHHKPAHGLRLQRHTTERLRCHRRHRHNIRRHQGCRHVINTVRQPEPAFQPQLHAGLGQVIDKPGLAVGSAKKDTVERLVSNLCQRPQQGFMSIPGGWARRQHDHRLILGEGNRVDGDHPRLRHSGRVEHLGIDAAWHNAQPCPFAELPLDLALHIVEMAMM